MPFLHLSINKHWTWPEVGEVEQWRLTVVVEDTLIHGVSLFWIVLQVTEPSDKDSKHEDVTSLSYPLQHKHCFFFLLVQMSKCLSCSIYIYHTKKHGKQTYVVLYSELITRLMDFTSDTKTFLHHTPDTN